MAGASAGGSSDDDSRCLMLVLSHDEAAVIFDGLADPLQPAVAVALSSTCLGLRTPLRAMLVVLQQRHTKAKALFHKLMNVLQRHTKAKVLRFAGGGSSRGPAGPSQLVLADLSMATSLETRGLTADEWATLASLLPWMPCLQEMNFSYDTNIGDIAGVQAVFNGLGRGALPLLRGLDLSNVQLGPLGAEVLAPALRRGAMPLLKELRLVENPLGNQGVSALLPALKKLPAFELLDLGGCGIDDEGVASLVENLGKDDFKTIKLLYFDENKITDVGCAKLVAALSAGALPAIEALYCVAGGAERISDHASKAANAAVDAALQKRLDAKQE